uniref:Uncharacterized protein n=1 Tax=Rhizophora mucronata TaxID=61149 RepID=A0A2P2PS72_RHIMU
MTENLQLAIVTKALTTILFWAKRSLASQHYFVLFEFFRNCVKNTCIITLLFTSNYVLLFVLSLYLSYFLNECNYFPFIL